MVIKVDTLNGWLYIEADRVFVVEKTENFSKTQWDDDQCVRCIAIDSKKVKEIDKNTFHGRVGFISAERERDDGKIILDRIITNTRAYLLENGKTIDVLIR